MPNFQILAPNMPVWQLATGGRGAEEVAAEAAAVAAALQTRAFGPVLPAVTFPEGEAFVSG